MEHIVSFSGGKDSTYMLLMMVEKGMRVDRVICVDTTKEFPAMYRHIEKVQAMIPIEIEIIKMDFDYWFANRIKLKGKNKGEVGYGWPGPRSRWCTDRKVQAIKKTLPKVCIEYIGIAFDEQKRLKKGYLAKDNIKTPLVEWEITEKQSLQYCYSKGLDWEGLYETMNRVSCWCCPLSRIGSLRALYNDFPELWKELQEMDKKSSRNFRRDYSVQELKEKFDNENIQLKSQPSE